VSSGAVAADGSKIEWWVEGPGAESAFEPLEVVGVAAFGREVLQSPLPVLVDFSKHGCGACRRLEPDLAKAQEDYAGRLKFVRVEVMASLDLLRRYQIRATPTVVVFRRGEEIGRAVNPAGTEALDHLIGQVLAGEAADAS
jgi:thioredoxin 1